MKERLVSERFYFESTAQISVKETFNYDPRGQLSVEQLIRQEPCFSHMVIQETSVWEKKTIIVNVDKIVCSFDNPFDFLLQYGFLIYITTEDRLIPLMQENLPEDTIQPKFLSHEDLKVLLKKHGLNESHLFVFTEDILSDCLNDTFLFQPLVDDHYNGMTAFIPEKKEIGRTYLYKTASNKLAYTMTNHLGARFDQVTDIEVLDELRASYHVVKIVLNSMAQHGHVKDYVNYDQSHHRLTLELKNNTIDAGNLQTLLRERPNLEVLTIDNCDINGELSSLSLPQLQSLSITGTAQPSLAQINQILQAAPKLHTVVMVNPSKRRQWVNTDREYLYFCSKIKLLKLSYDYLPVIQIPIQSKLIALQILATSKIEPRDLDLKNLNQIIQMNALDYLDLTRVELTETLELPSHVWSSPNFAVNSHLSGPSS